MNLLSHYLLYFKVMTVPHEVTTDWKWENTT